MTTFFADINGEVTWTNNEFSPPSKVARDTLTETWEPNRLMKSDIAAFKNFCKRISLDALRLLRAVDFS